MSILVVTIVTYALHANLFMASFNYALADKTTDGLVQYTLLSF